MLEKQSVTLPSPFTSTQLPHNRQRNDRYRGYLFTFVFLLFLVYLTSVLHSSHQRTSKKCDHSSEKTWEYAVVEGFFLQDDPKHGAVTEAVLPRLGLIDDSPDRWSIFKDKISKLQENAPEDVSYKVIYLSRHGQGYHNVAESLYGTPAWNAHWSLLYTDNENLTWGPDPLLTPLGKEQAVAVANGWKTELALPNVLHGKSSPPPLPEVLWTSPLSRAAHTLNITYHDILLSPSSSPAPAPPRPVFKENLRESIGFHTCDARSTSYYLATTFSRSKQNPENPSNFAFEDGFEIHDDLWKPDERETPESQQARTRLILDELFDDHPETYIALVGHGGTISSFFAVTGHKPCSAPTGALIPVVVKGVRKSSSKR